MPDVLVAVEAALVEHFAHPPQRASVSFLGADAIQVLRFEPIPGERAYVTLGMAAQPMTGADDSVRSTGGPRAELVLHVRDPTDEYADVWRKLAVLAAAPVVEGVVYAPGMSLDLGERMSAGSLCSGVVVTEFAVAAVDTDAGPVELLQAIPATATELAWCRVRGSAALRRRWAEDGTDLLDLARKGVLLD